MRVSGLTVLLVIFISSCALKVDQTEARKQAEGLLTDLKNEKYNDLDKYYSDISNESQSQEKKTERFQQLRETTGPIVSFEFMDAKEEYDSDQHMNQLTLKYKVVCAKVTVLYTFLFINDEGTSRIFFQNIENMK